MKVLRPNPAVFVDEPEYDCTTCRDTGFRRMEATEADYGHPTVTRCECRLPRNNSRLVKQAMAHAGMKADEIESAYGRWDETHQAKPEFAREWLEGAMTGDLAGVTSPWCLGLLGEPGRGKSKTAAVCMRLFIEAEGKRPLWIRVPEGFDQVQAERRSDVYLAESALEKRIERAGLVVFDDFGITHRADPDLIENTVNEWLARRHRRHGLSIITSNAPTLGQIGAPRIESRIAEGVYRVMQADADYRDRL